MKETQETESRRDDVHYSAEIGDRICAEMIDGKSLRSVCEMEGMPTKKTVMRWLRTHPEFKQNYDLAQRERAQVYAEDIVDIADNASNDWMETNDPDNQGYRFNGEHVQRSKLRLEARKWICSKLLPKLYGDKIAVGGAEDLPPIGTTDMSESEIARRIAFALANGVRPAQETTH
jgi:hypothetical protein